MAYRNSYTLDGVALTNLSAGYFLEKSTGLRLIPAKRSPNISYPGVDGDVFIPGAVYQPGGVAVTMYVEGADHQQFMERIEFLNGLFLQRHKLLPLRHDYNVANTVYREAMVKCTSSSQVKMLTPTSGTIDYGLEIPSSFWRAGTESTSASPAVTASTQTYSVVSLNGGNAPVSDARIRVKGAFSTLLIKDVATGSLIQLTGAITSSQYVIITPDEWFAKKVISDTWDRYSAGSTDYSTFVVSNRGQGSQFITEPSIVGGALTYQLELWATGASSSPVVEIRAKKAYL